MKKTYVAPDLEIERYELDASIASNCATVVTMGYSMRGTEPVYNVQFYEDTNCDCYTTGGDYGYWTS